jgi:hypothetical protein
MENDVLTESSMIFLGSTCPEHRVKGGSLHLFGDFGALEADEEKKRRDMAAVQAKLAAAHGVDAHDIIIVGVREGSIQVDYAVRSGVRYTGAVDGRVQAQFGPVCLHHDQHPSFSHLQIDPRTFDPQWNRDFTRPGMCPQGERRGGYPYIPPAGWKRFGMNVLGKFQGGDQWLGMENSPGEWAAVYHGTKCTYVKSITENPLETGPHNFYGDGIYCSSNPVIAEKYTDVLTLRQSSERATYRYMFHCRVNVSNVHHCQATPCPEARSSQYTLHETQEPGIWFVNCRNESYQNIRAYGLLVKEQ